MKRLTMCLDDELAGAFEALVRARGYENRSAVFRDLLRQDLGKAGLRDRPEEPCVATLSHVDGHHQRQRALRLTDLQHDHHELTVSTTHAHLDHDHCIETVILRGRTAQVRAFAESVITQPGVSHGHAHRAPASAHPTAPGRRGKRHRHSAARPAAGLPCTTCLPTAAPGSRPATAWCCGRSL